MDIESYKDFADIAFKLMGIFVALYIAPIKKSTDNMSREMGGYEL